MECVDLDTAIWRKSSYSDGGDNNCVEVAGNLPVPGLIPLRDSKTPDGPVVIFHAEAWQTFVEAVGGGNPL